jgi:hypothetical protein
MHVLKVNDGSPQLQKMDMTSFDLNANLRYFCGMRLVESLTTLIVMNQISKAEDSGTKTYHSM